MISFDEALHKILASVTSLGWEEKKILDCLGQVSAADIAAPFNVPAYANSAMDGYAVRAADVKNASAAKPAVLKVKGEVPAGIFPRMKVGASQCVRIMTGGIIPRGADTVIPVEATDFESRKNARNKLDSIGITEPLKRGSHIRRAGEDVVDGELILAKGMLLRSAEIGVLASLGMSKIKVIRRPVVAILATGSELISTRAKLTPGKLYNSNTYSIASQVREFGGVPKILGVAKDKMNSLTSALARGLDSDLMVTTGGVSVGEYDMVKNVMKSEGRMNFWRVRMKPGRPLAYGTFNRVDGGTVPHLGLPGNPVSCMLDFELFGRPLILKLMGRSDLERPMVSAILENDVVNSDGRRIFARVRIQQRKGKYYARLTGAQGSGILTSMVKANALAIIPETEKEARKGEVVNVIMLN
ncbi:MAG TPA: gephyrin-like molybdotransferase Glp [Dehalococcoidia bacterium]|nr:gephyrin-like molybdotransferase Glp [Dehalococcoidia bacterium]